MSYDSQYMYESSNGNYGVIIPTIVIGRIKEMCARSIPNETGGILIGKYSKDCKWAEIIDATSPPEGSEHSARSFVRCGEKILCFLNQLWEQNQYYVGEWHYHPNFSPIPSGIDLRTIYKFSKNKKLNCPEPVMLIIGGNPSNWSEHIAVYVKDQEIILHKLS